MTDQNREELKAVIKEAILELFAAIGSCEPRNSEQPTRPRKEPTRKGRTERNLAVRTTTAPVVPPKDQELKAEWIRPDDGPRYCGLSRRTLYNLIEDGKIESRYVRARGQIRGIRLISCDSLNDYIKSQLEESGPFPAQ